MNLVSSEPLPLDLADVIERGRRRIMPFGAVIHYSQMTGSTNDVAARLAERGAPEGTMVLASGQTAGRGRLGREWYSPADAGLYCSLLTRNRGVAPFLTLAGGVAVAEGVRSATALPVEIKWPNDIVVSVGGASAQRRKLAGILAEASTGADGLHYVVLGFGVNLRATAYPPGIANRATSLETELGRPVEAGRLLVEIVAAFASLFAALVAGNSGMVLERWRALAPSASGASVECETSGGRCEGITAGITDDGALLVRTSRAIERIIAGEVLWR